MTGLDLPNRSFYQGDNLPFLRGISSESIHLIATDPPFNKDRDFGEAFRDRWSWDRDVRDKWIADIKGERPALWSVIETARHTFDENMSAYLCWLGIRLLELHRVLRAEGSLYLHIDHTTHAYVKLALDAVFGADKFRNEIVWYYKTGGVSKRWFGRKHDTILFYSKSDKYVFHPQQEKSYLSHKYGFSNISLDEDKNGVFRMAAMRDVWDIPACAAINPKRPAIPRRSRWRYTSASSERRVSKAISCLIPSAAVAPRSWRPSAWGVNGWRRICGKGRMRCCVEAWRRRACISRRS